MRVLVVCTGNSCRSQMAEAFLKDFDPSIEVLSAGVLPEKQVSPYTIRIMNEAFIDIANNRTKSVESCLYMNFDYLITLSNYSKEKCSKLKGKVRNMVHIPVEDPAEAIGTEEAILEKYREVRNQIKFEMFDFYLNTIKSVKNNAV